MLYFLCVVIFLNHVMESKQAVIPSLAGGFSNWRRKKTDRKFMLEFLDSAHNEAWRKYEALEE